MLFGGHDGAYALGDTWEWDGENWAEVATAVRPPARRNHGLAFHAGRGRVVLFGGDGLGVFGDTWEWDGRDWVQRSSQTSPSARWGHALAYDTRRGRVVLAGGLSARDPFETWEWDGDEWLRRAPISSPTPRGQHGLAYDASRGRLVLFGGIVAGQSVWLAETWEWDGDTWHLRAPSVRPPPLMGHGLAFDAQRSRVVLFGGVTSTVLSSDTWEWDGNTWWRATPEASPPARGWHAMAYDGARQRVLLFGGAYRGNPPVYLDDTWELEGDRWTPRVSGSRPTARAQHAMAYDSARERVVLFGGSNSNFVVTGTWEWDGSSWSLRQPPVSPPGRWAHAMAYDKRRRRVVLFGGAFPALGDTWEWDGTVWMERLPAVSPTARWGHAMAYDELRERVVLFGGEIMPVPYTAQADTWEWDGETWTRRAAPPAQPTARAQHSMTYDAGRGRVVFFAGMGSTSIFPNADTWEWDGGVWVRREPVVRPPARTAHASAYDARARRIVLFGGVDASYVFGDTWVYGPVQHAEYSSFGIACAGGAGIPRLASRGLPYLGGTMDIRIDGLRAGQAGVLLFGSSASRWGALALPLDLAAMGMPGCALYVSGDGAVDLPTAGGAAALPLTIPPLAVLDDARWFNQYFSLDPGANPLGVTASNAAAATCRWP